MINRVAEAREKLGFSRAHLARISGVSVKTIKAIEEGGRSPVGITMLKLAKALKARVEELFELEEGD